MSAALGGGYQSQDSSYNNQQTQTTNRNLTPYQGNLQPGLFKTISDYMTNPMQAIAPQVNQAKNSVNNQYAGLADRLRQQFLSNGGGGQSGKQGYAQVAGELGRSGALADVENQGAVTAAQLPMSAAQLAEQWLNMNFGQTSTGSASGTGSQSGFNFGGGIGGGGGMGGWGGKG